MVHEGSVGTTQTMVASAVKVGKWDVQLGGVPQRILGLRPQGAKSWLRPGDGIRWKNACKDVVGMKPEYAVLVPPNP